MNVFRVEQKLVSQPLENIEAEVFRQLDSLGLRPPRGRVAVTAGSRGIDNIVRITKAAGDWLRANGADPFLVPCMGSHNGATAEGQREMIESLGLTEAATGMEIRPGQGIATIWMVQHAGFPGQGGQAQEVFKKWARERFGK